MRIRERVMVIRHNEPGSYSNTEPQPNPQWFIPSPCDLGGWIASIRHGEVNFFRDSFFHMLIELFNTRKATHSLA